MACIYKAILRCCPKSPPHTADSICDLHILSATILEYSFTLFNLPKAAVCFDDYVFSTYSVINSIFSRNLTFSHAISKLTTIIWNYKMKIDRNEFLRP